LRIDIDTKDIERLEQIKHKKWLNGKGYASTVRHILDEYEQNETVEKLIDRRFDELNKNLTAAVITAFKRFFSNLFSQDSNP
jgi:hypothetical protein